MPPSPSPAVRARTLVLAGLFLAGGAAALGPASPGSERLECGDLAPFDNQCGDCCAEFEGEAEASVNLLPYEGRLVVRLKNVAPTGGSWTWTCYALGTLSEHAPVLGSCAGPAPSPGRGLRKDDRVSLDCFAHPLEGPPVEVPPAGTYGCTVSFPD